MAARTQTQTWLADRYAKTARYVADLAGAVLDLLAPKAGERILDLGCGDGALTEKLVGAGAVVVGVDGSEDMVRAARERGIDARVMDAHELDFRAEFDAVFSNAALHWMLDPDIVIRRVKASLKPGGRFVAEFGGHGCNAAILVAIAAVLARRGIDARKLCPWYFPTVDDYRERLEAAGFVVDYIALIPRPTSLPAGMEAFLDTFAENFFRALSQEDQIAAKREIVELLRPVLCDSRGRWTADYTRLRFAAHVST